jgi:hypothetical protein
MYLIHLEIRIWRGSFHIYFKKWEAGEKNFFGNFERYNLANGEE